MSPYFRERIVERMRLQPSDYIVSLSSPDRYGGERVAEWPVFGEDDNGNITILLYDVHRRVIMYQNPKIENRKTPNFNEEEDTLIAYKVTRLNKENFAIKQERHRGERVGKYNFPVGQGVYPFFPPKLLDKFEKKTHIETLILTEGYFKAMSASMCGLDIVGLSSIMHYADSSTHCLNNGISEIIQECGVKNVIILHDGDCMDISLEALKRGEDIGKRPVAFFKAAENTRKVLIDEGVSIYYGFVNTHYLTPDEKTKERPKGIDDLLCQDYYIDKTSSITGELLNLRLSDATFFVKRNITKGLERIKTLFGLSDVKYFYEKHASLINNADLNKYENGLFNYLGNLYRYDSQEDKLVREMPKELKYVFRVGDYFFHDVPTPSRADPTVVEYKTESILKSTIIDYFGKDVIVKIPRYYTWCNVPDHINYQKEWHGCKNRYKELPYKPEEGPFPNIDFMMHHIFGEQYELGMDYMQLLYNRPMQILPILCLVSAERGTGKSSFLDMIRAVFGENYVGAGNRDISSDFNEFMSCKLVVGIDESRLGDRAEITEKLKMLSTAKEELVNPKGQNQYTVANYKKFILCSNNENNFVYAESDEVRFWVRKILPIPKEELKPEILKEFQREAKHFAYYLMNRKMSVPKACGRMWFSPESIKTEALGKLNLAQRKPDEVALYNWIREYFYQIRADSFDITYKQIRECVKFTYSVTDLRLEFILANSFGKPKYDVLENEIGKKIAIKTCHIMYQTLNGEYIDMKHKARFYHFVAEEVLIPKDYEEFVRIINNDQYE